LTPFPNASLSLSEVAHTQSGYVCGLSSERTKVYCWGHAANRSFSIPLSGEINGAVSSNPVEVPGFAPHRDFVRLSNYQGVRVASSTCTEVRFTATDYFGRPSASAEAATVQISNYFSGQPGYSNGDIYSDASCATPATQVSFVPKDGGLSLWVKGGRNGEYLYFGLTGPKLYDEWIHKTVRTGPASKLEIYTNYIVAGSCRYLSVNVTDSWGNSVDTASLNASLISSSPTGRFVNPSDCSTPVSSPFAFVRSGSSGPLNGSVAYRDDTPPASTTFTMADLSATLTQATLSSPGYAAFPSVSLSTTSASAVANVCVPVQITVSNSVPDSLSGAIWSSVGTLYSDSSCSTFVDRDDWDFNTDPSLTKTIYFKDDGTSGETSVTITREPWEEPDGLMQGSASLTIPLSP